MTSVPDLPSEPSYRLDEAAAEREHARMAGISGRITVRLTPRAAREEIAGERDGALLVRVTAPPVDGAANEALVRLVAKTVGVPKSAVRIVSGETSRTKILEVTGMDSEVLRTRLVL